MDNIRIQKISPEWRNVKNIQDKTKARYYSWKIKYIQRNWKEMILQHCLRKGSEDHSRSKVPC